MRPAYQFANACSFAHELVAYDGDGQPASVKYHVLPTLLLAEVQRLERERAAQADAIEELRKEVRALRDEQR